MIRHLVFLKYPDNTAATIKADILRDLSDLRHEVDGFLDFHHGPNLSPEDDVVRGFRDMFWIDFRDATARDAYLQNPTHGEIAGRLLAAVDGGVCGVFACDIELP